MANTSTAPSMDEHGYNIVCDSLLRLEETTSVYFPSRK